MDAKSDDKMGGMLSWIALAIFSSVLLMVLVFSEPAHSAFCTFSEKSGTSCLRDFLSEFQTLITGLAAVIAASATVYVMIRTDAAQEARHRELVQLTLRSDRLAAERALVPQAVELQRIQMAIDSQITRASTYRGAESFRKGSAELAESVNRALALCAKTINREAFVDGSRLFDGPLAATTQHFRGNLESRRKRCRDCFGPLNSDSSNADAPAWSGVEIDTLALKVFRDASEISNELAVMIEGFRRMSRTYGLPIELAPYP